MSTKSQLVCLMIVSVLLCLAGCSSGGDVSESDAIKKIDQIEKANAKNEGRKAPEPTGQAAEK